MGLPARQEGRRQFPFRRAAQGHGLEAQGCESGPWGQQAQAHAPHPRS